MRPVLFHFLQYLATADPGHLHVGYDNIHLAFGQESQGCFRVGNGRNGIIFVFKQGLQHKKIIFFIVYNKDVGFFTHFFLRRQAG